MLKVIRLFGHFVKSKSARGYELKLLLHEDKFRKISKLELLPFYVVNKGCDIMYI